MVYVRARNARKMRIGIGIGGRGMNVLTVGVNENGSGSGIGSVNVSVNGNEYQSGMNDGLVGGLDRPRRGRLNSESESSVRTTSMDCSRYLGEVDCR
jgi:hypothetical protein